MFVWGAAGRLAGHLQGVYTQQWGEMGPGSKPNHPVAFILLRLSSDLEVVLPSTTDQGESLKKCFDILIDSKV